jgi:hypothetical protein
MNNNQREIMSESVKNAVLLSLMTNFSGVLAYKESQTSPQFPHFFVEQLNLTSREQRQGYFWLNYFMTARYRVAADTAPIRDLAARLDGVVHDLAVKLTEVNIAGLSVDISNFRTEKVDGVLHCFFNVIFQVKRESIETDVKMWNLEIKQILKEVQ